MYVALPTSEILYEAATSVASSYASDYCHYKRFALYVHVRVV